MSDWKSLDYLGPIADEMLGGLHADERMRLAVRRAAMEGAAPKKRKMRLVPAVCCAALALVCVGAAGMRTDVPDMPDEGAVMIMKRGTEETAQPVAISAIAAGGGAAFAGDAVMVADLGDGARMRMAAPEESLFAAGSGDMPLIAVGGGVYRMLETPKDIENPLLDDSLGDVALFSDQPSLASREEMNRGLSNVAQKGAVIYSIKGLSESTVVAAEVDNDMRLFQRVSYAGKGPAGGSLEDTFDVRGKVRKAELSGVGTITGEKANEVIAVLLDEAVLASADASARGQYLTVTLENGLRLQLGVSGDMLCGCGGWSCPAFFEAFEAAL
ncbi:MAG: hypothetical protein IKK34_05245 [Clostridia bacterium]|nr:hypothetical protein [Clostridia bacterium]